MGAIAQRARRWHVRVSGSLALIVLAVALGSPSAAGAGTVTWGLGVQGSWSFRSEPGAARLFSPTGYDATMVRDIVPYCQSSTDCTQTLGQIQTDVSYFGQSALFITLQCVSSAPCGASGTAAESNLKATLPQLMARFPNIAYWGAQNEPAAGGKPTTNSPVLASKLWLDAATIAQNPTMYGVPAGTRVVVAGEGGGGSYAGSYETSIASGLSHRPGLNAPTTWSVHPYNDVICAQTTMTAAFRDQLLGAAVVGPAVRHIWLSEAGAHLASPQQKASSSLCENGKNMVSSNPLIAARAQIKSADTFLALPNVDPLIDHAFYYTPNPASAQCWGGGMWDSSLYTPMSAQRPAYAVLVTHLNPNPSSYPLSVLLPPSEWQSACGLTTISGQASATTVNQGQPVTITVTVAQGSVAPGQPLPMPSGVIHFYEATLQLGWVQLNSSATASTTLVLPPGTQTVYADLADPIYKLKTPYSVTITVQ
jgi:hypothetical protein